LRRDHAAPGACIAPAPVYRAAGVARVPDAARVEETSGSTESTLMAIPYTPGKPLTCDEIRALDRVAIETLGVPGIVLMENAGRGAAEYIYSVLGEPAGARVLILCGPGNNGGDGFVIARHLHNAGVTVHVALAAPPGKIRGDAATNLNILHRLGLTPVAAYEPEGLEVVRRCVDQADVIVDALLGTGSTGSPRGVMATLIELANGAPRAQRVAIDVPTGLDADNGAVYEPCFRATATVTMLAPKVGFETAAGRAVAGEVVVVSIGVPRDLGSLPPGLRREVDG